MGNSNSLNKYNIGNLDLKVNFELIPDCPAATSAGYTLTDRENAQVWYSPTIDNGKFY
jgi:hypothetical protein